MQKKKVLLLIFGVVFLAGLALVLYPVVSRRVSDKGQTDMIELYEAAVSSLGQEEIDRLWREAEAYNDMLFENGGVPTENMRNEYWDLLDITGTGMMGYIDIPTVGCRMPMYHGADPNTLQVGIGHIDWSSLIVGGENAHSVLSGHSGLPSAELFTDIRELGEGDVFYLNVLGRKLKYEVFSVLVVTPDDSEALMIEEGQDRCTLVTCTPYGINSHRLLVQGILKS